MKKIAILGSTGSIGQQALDVIRQHADKFEVVALSAGKNHRVLADQIEEFKPLAASILDPVAAGRLEDALYAGTKTNILSGESGATEIAREVHYDILLNALVGSMGLAPTIAAIKTGAVIALANKETMVAGGELIRAMDGYSPLRILPVDSEHSAIFQCLHGENSAEVARILLTGSGGPFRTYTKEQKEQVTLEEALKHPRWVMGPKITVDSSTMMNKGLEVIEAHYLFDIGYDKIEVVIHPESIIHSMVEFCDGSIKAHLGFTDMRIPIQYALSYPERFNSALTGMDMASVGSLTFASPDFDDWPCLRLAYDCGRAGGTYPAVLNAANEKAVAAFLDRRISYVNIYDLISQVVNSHDCEKIESYEDILTAEAWANMEMDRLLSKADY